MLGRVLGKVLSLLGAVGIDGHKILGYRNLPRFFGEYRAFTRAGGVVTSLSPHLSDYSASAGIARGAYFHQDLLVASFVYQAKPTRHIDVGSRIDGFVAHVAAFRPIEIMDVREVSVSVENISFLKADLMQESSETLEIADSVSCLHAIEHFGLGRYGDPISPNGHIQGFRNIWRMVKPGGRLYISFPVATQSSVVFNAHRVFSPMEIFKWSPDRFELVSFDFVDDEGDLHRNFPLAEGAPKAKYGCGIYTLRKPTHDSGDLPAKIGDS